MPENANAKVYDIFMFVLIFELVALAAYAIGAIVLFFVLREKYKNDEFRRMKPKAYVKTAVLGYVGLLIISITVLFIIFRAGLFSNAVAVHNPIDVFIVVPGVISIVIIGYFIKFIVGKFKSNKQRRQAKKLKLNEDAVDDGTK
jgi:NADH:ubiquinone oxidoreductase subunit 5 (subunit L)/multisubunit Na+/H+ antiporter MnhA subunit